MNKDSLSVGLATLIGISLIVVGGSAVVAPKFAATMYGVAMANGGARAFVWATATRDIAIGCWLLALVLMGVGRRVLAISVMMAALIPTGDAIIVLVSAPNPSAAALALHVSSVVVFLALGFWFYRE